jgi:hypothetical protein
MESALGIDCPDLVARPPDQAAAALAAAGFHLSWRHVHTAPDGTSFADVVSVAPSGRIVDIILDGMDATIFVANPTDPAAQSPGPPTC